MSLLSHVDGIEAFAASDPWICSEFLRQIGRLGAGYDNKENPRGGNIMDQVIEMVEEVAVEQAVVELTAEEIKLVSGGTLAGSLL